MGEGEAQPNKAELAPHLVERKEMQQVVNRKCYDTEKAEEVHRWSLQEALSGLKSYRRRRDLDLVIILYKTEKGNFFLNGVYKGKTDIWPVSPEKAFSWLERRNAQDALLAHFPEEIEEA